MIFFAIAWFLFFAITATVLAWITVIVFLILRQLWRIARWCGIKAWLWSVDHRVSRAI